MILNEDNNNACERDFHNKELPQDLESPCKKRKVQVQPISESIATDDDASQTDFQKILSSVVKIYSVATEPNFAMPWQMKKQTRSTSSGFIIEGKKIITNAHSILYQTSLLIRRHGHARRYKAKILEVGHECDLALLTVEEEEFWKGAGHIQFGGIPESVTVVGYPTGGDNISVTTGVVSRIDITTYSHSCSKLLSIQIDAAINSGNSGGPAMLNNKLIGVAFETLSDAENIGYIIPIPIIEHFLQDIERHGSIFLVKITHFFEGHYRGFCDLGVSCQAMENMHLRNFIKMPLDQTGIIVNRTDKLSPAYKHLKQFDVIMKADGIEIADDGTIEFRNGERISFRYHFLSKYIDDPCNLTVLRNGEIINVSVTMAPPVYLVPVHMHDKSPSYFIFAGFVFVPLTRTFMRHQFGKDWDKKAPINICNKVANGQKEFEGQEIIILAQVLAAEINIGYQNFGNMEVQSVNGIPVRNLRHLVEIVENNSEPFLKIELEMQRCLILEFETAKSCNSTLLEQHSIVYSKSKDLILQSQTSQ